MNQVSDEELKRVIADFLDMGHVDNIVAMFRREPRYYDWTGEILADRRFAVRLGISILFEELKSLQPEELALAVPSLRRALHSEEPLLRGEAVSILGIIGTAEAIELVRSGLADPNPQVREMAALVLDEL
ncbi:HEAT repeat domain-containing protein [Desulfoprunum benzoelyticum]|uniref:HEAT repeat protein n=1 Tax=Desulfoprunum benzoelyticum TaxID=1506996 RepID=A0A840UZU9_9BACT|nr:HEAT repeat domain-containing protein [Desulfoprunum benzoelyticum]MBB5347080.1 HEAT repeat protein [Desulfoprunum benzoelyticum]MBM9529774.1 HEAT repeat domain-containing protein [Desulfoprunum benzoelyticum]